MPAQLKKKGTLDHVSGMRRCPNSGAGMTHLSWHPFRVQDGCLPAHPGCAAARRPWASVCNAFSV